MADDRAGRDAQAHDEERRQRERDLAEELRRGDETEPPADPESLDEVAQAVAGLGFPATAAEVVAVAGDHEVIDDHTTHTVAELLPNSDALVFPSPAAVRARVERPTVAGAIKRIVEAGDTLQNSPFTRSKREAYERTLRALANVDADDDDETVGTVTDWIVGRIDDTGSFPASRRVRKEAAAVCRQNGYEIRDDEWLGA